jgi:hypothetical protein
MPGLRSRQPIQIAPAALEWVLAVAFLACVIAVGVLIVGELRAAPLPPRAAPVARVLSTSVPPSVPARAVSVPALPFQDGKEVKVGDSVSAVATTLGRAAELGRQEVDRGSFGERLTRYYEYDGARFILVFEPFERQGEAKLSAIYLP